MVLLPAFGHRVHAQRDTSDCKWQQMLLPRYLHEPQHSYSHFTGAPCPCASVSLDKDLKLVLPQQAASTGQQGLVTAAAPTCSMRRNAVLLLSCSPHTCRPVFAGMPLGSMGPSQSRQCMLTFSDTLSCAGGLALGGGGARRFFSDLRDTPETLPRERDGPSVMEREDMDGELGVVKQPCWERKGESP